MSHTARRFADKPAQRIDVPKLSKVTREEAQHLPLLDRVLLQEHERHACRLADIRRVADKLAALDAIVRTAQADGAYIDITAVRLSYASHRISGNGRRVNAVVLQAADTFSSWRDPKSQNAVANALLAAGWRVVDAEATGSEISRDRVIFMHGQRAVETSCMRQWVIDAIEAGHITAATQGRHPATDTGTPLNAGTAGEVAAVCAP
ncbi:hypothetical protein M0765_000690 [Variovorax sp. S2]|uniref:hypothetical protein n=1 Tax=Variovorax sp. S12S4 TaxID=3029170 RepID=UPI00215D2BE5|nr:hypothetical protein [Variovorax sp. S12S4]MCR8956296.1 hypothetical protein [Variovorax sp. S12S4]